MQRCCVKQFVVQVLSAAFLFSRAQLTQEKLLRQCFRGQPPKFSLLVKQLPGFRVYFNRQLGHGSSVCIVPCSGQLGVQFGCSTEVKENCAYAQADTSG